MIRFAIWCAVSTAEQAKDDKASLAEQERKCRQAGEGKGWHETMQPFIVAGESRTRWVNLRDAEEELPPLREMLEAARLRQFDVLIMYDYNRLRDLLDPVAKTLASYGVQIYSVSQPVEPMLPDEFNPYASDSASMMQGMALIISRWQIADLRRKYRYGITSRVQRGLYSTRIPYGYSKNGSEIPSVVPDEARAVIEIKNMFLAGKSIRTILAYLNKTYSTARGAPEWSRPTIVRILTNPFYAGKVFFGMTRRISDGRNNVRRVVKNPNPTISDGKHKPLYSWEDYQAILAEFERRASLPNNNKYAYSGLLRCSVCGRRLYHWRKYSRWRCDYRGGHHTHISLKDEEAHRIIPPAIQKAVRDVNIVPVAHNPTQDDMDAREGLERQRRRIQQGYESGIYSLEEAQERIKKIDEQIASLNDVDKMRQRRDAEQRRLREVVEEVQRRIDAFPRWIQEREPGVVNQLLLRLCSKIVISPEGEVTVYIRGV